MPNEKYYRMTLVALKNATEIKCSNNNATFHFIVTVSYRGVGKNALALIQCLAARTLNNRNRHLFMDSSV